MAGHDQPPPDQDLAVRVRQDELGVVVQVSGEIDLANCKQFETALMHALKDEPNILVVDLSNITFLGSAGLNNLVTANQAAGPGVLRVVAGVTPRRAIEVTGLDEVLTISVSVDEALMANT